MAESMIKLPLNNVITPVSTTESMGDYSHAKLYQVLRNNNEIIPNKICAFYVPATGGPRMGFCFLYGNTKQYGWIMAGHFYYMPVYLTVADGVVRETPFIADRQIMHNFAVTIDASNAATGGKTFDITIPSGYTLASNRIYGSYVSGNPLARATDKSATFMRDGLVRINVYIYNSGNAVQLTFAGDLYLKKVE